MKTKLVLLTLLVCGITTAAFSSHNDSTLRTEREDLVELHGTQAGGGLRSSQTLFYVTKNPSFVNVTYLKNLGPVTIEIIDVTGASEVVYRTTVTPVYGQQLPIGISGLAEGNYMITFRDNSNGYMYGYFQITE